MNENIYVPELGMLFNLCLRVMWLISFGYILAASNTRSELGSLLLSSILY
jgi:hypothetical protein